MKFGCQNQSPAVVCMVAGTQEAGTVCKLAGGNDDMGKQGKDEGMLGHPCNSSCSVEMAVADKAVAGNTPSTLKRHMPRT